MVNSLPAAIPDRDILRRLRIELGLDQGQLAYDCLGFKAPNGADVVRRWENDPEFHPTNLAWQAFRYLAMVVQLYKTLPDGEVRDRTRRLLPECLRGNHD